MAIQLARELPQGVSANYWRLDRFFIHINYAGDDYGEGLFNLYENAAAAAAGKEPFSNEKCRQLTTGAVGPGTTVEQIVSAIENAAIAEGGILEGGTIV